MRLQGICGPPNRIAFMERVDADGRVTGFSILGVSQYSKDKPLIAELASKE
jgi:hypothetical protein